MICPKCGSEMPDGSSFCTKCGAPLGGAQAGPQGGSQAGPQGGSQAGPQPGPMPNNAGAQAGPQPGPNPNPQMNAGPQPGPQPNGGMPPYGAPVYVDPKDHTGEFSAKDISDNKVLAIVPYIMGFIGIIIALLATKESPFVTFHVRQALKITVSGVILGILVVILYLIMFVGTIATGNPAGLIAIVVIGVICALILLVVRIICFFWVCMGKAKEAPIVSSFGFLK